MIAAIIFCFSMVALGQFWLYYWRASIAITADRQISDRVKVAAGIPAAPVTARDFRAILSVHDLTPELQGLWLRLPDNSGLLFNRRRNRASDSHANRLG